MTIMEPARDGQASNLGFLNPVNAKGHVLMATLNYKPELHHQVNDSLESAFWSLHINGGWRATRTFLIGSADICESRNRFITQFWKREEFTHALFHDGDVSWEPGTVERMLSHELDMVLGAYPKRGDGEGFPVKFLDTETPHMVDPKTGESKSEGGLIRIKGGGAGCLLISRAVVTKMVEAYPDLWYHYPNVVGGKALSFFEFAVLDHKRTSEDINFCRLWREIGGTVWCDPWLKLNHHGDKTWSGRFVDELRMMMGPQERSEKIIRVPA